MLVSHTEQPAILARIEQDMATNLCAYRKTKDFERNVELFVDYAAVTKEPRGSA